jgi:hypothetical protein
MLPYGCSTGAGLRSARTRGSLNKNRGTRPSTALRFVCLLTSLLAIALTHSPVAAQVPAGLEPSDTIYEVELLGGSMFLGRIVRVDDAQLTLQTTAGAEITLERAQIRAMRPVRGRTVGGEYWRADPNTTRLFFAPTGRALRQGEGYFGVYELFIPFVSYGVTNNITMSGGSPFYFGMFGETPPVYFAPKVRVASAPQVDFSLGGLFVFIPDEDVFGILYGVGTFGTEDNAVTAGLGWGYIDQDFASRPAAMLGGEMRTGRSTKLITENWFVPGEAGLIFSGGLRFFGERLSADAGLIGFVFSDDSGCCLPLVNFVYSFGKRR